MKLGRTELSRPAGAPKASLISRGLCLIKIQHISGSLVVVELCYGQCLVKGVTEKVVEVESVSKAISCFSYQIITTNGSLTLYVCTITTSYRV